MPKGGQQRLRRIRSDAQAAVTLRQIGGRKERAAPVLIEVRLGTAVEPFEHGRKPRLGVSSSHNSESEVAKKFDEE